MLRDAKHALGVPARGRDRPRDRAHAPHDAGGAEPGQRALAGSGEGPHHALGIQSFIYVVYTLFSA